MVTVSRWMGICFAGILALSLGTTLAEDDKEKKEDEAKEHATAKKVLAAAKIDLLAAVKAATQKFPEGKAFLAETEEQEGKAIFTVHILVDDKVKEVEVDAVSGKVIKAEDDKDDDADEAKEAKAALAKTKTTLAAAIASALKGKENAKAFEASIEMEEGEEPEVLVEYLDGDKIVSVQIDPANGKVLKAAEEKEEKEKAKEDKEEKKE
jgi:uncharacterized membrane protein YkoI